MGVNRAEPFRPVGVAVSFERAKAEAFHQVRWRLLTHCKPEALSCEPL